MRYNNLISPLTTLYENLWHHSMYYVSYMTLYDIQEIFSTSMENQNYTIFSLWIFLYDPCMICGKSYMVLVWLPRIHTNHIWPSMITKNHIWPSTKSKKIVWSLTRELAQIGANGQWKLEAALNSQFSVVCTIGINWPLTSTQESFKKFKNGHIEVVYFFCKNKLFSSGLTISVILSQIVSLTFQLFIGSKICHNGLFSPSNFPFW